MRLTTLYTFCGPCRQELLHLPTKFALAQNAWLFSICRACDVNQGAGQTLMRARFCPIIAKFIAQD
jgi:hypothetical protein